MEFSAEQIAGLLEGDIVGDQSSIVSGLSKIEDGKAGTLSFLANPKYEDHLYSTGASIVIVGKDFQPQKEVPSTCTLIKVAEPYSAFSKLLDMYDQAIAKQPKIEEGSHVSKSANVGEDVYIGAFAYIGENVTIGDGVHVYPHSYVGDNVNLGAGTIVYSGVHIYRDCQVGKSCTLHSGSIIGADGFGFAPNSENNYKKVPQIGNVILEDHVSIGANTTVDRATLGSTVVKKGVKLDNLIQIGHNVVIGENTVMAAQVGVAGSTKLGKNMMIGGQAGIVGHIDLADGTMIGAQSGIGKGTKKEGEMLLGSPAFAAEDYKKSYMGFRRLPYILNKLRELEAELEDIKEKNKSNG
ncbi:MAG: UDP-3-O-[3-hydroxymyristoyl] glucosamine N-acyltransferase [Arenicella sp.]|jgi:UDP-3-O-[3-hydroxymyristoyl] glucosamine N-acyltransferase